MHESLRLIGRKRWDHVNADILRFEGFQRRKAARVHTIRKEHDRFYTSRPESCRRQPKGSVKPRLSGNERLGIRFFQGFKIRENATLSRESDQGFVGGSEIRFLKKFLCRDGGCVSDACAPIHKEKDFLPGGGASPSELRQCQDQSENYEGPDQK